MRLNPNKTWRPDIGKRLGLRYETDGEWINPYEGTVPVGFGAAVKSDYTMDVEVSASGYEPGATISLKAYLADRGWPSPKGHVIIKATRPEGGVDYFELFDDGTHNDAVANDGTYSNTYDRTPMTGSYKFFFDGHGTNERGEMVPRQATRYVSLNAETPPSGGKDGRERCLPCWMQFLLVFLEIFIIWLIIRCCCRMRRDNAKR